MPGADKKWDAAAERDLCVAIIMGNQESDRVRYNWTKVHSFMENYGYPFTKDAISQHFSKVIMKDFKARHNGGKGSSSSTPATPKKTSTPKNKGTSSASAKRRRNKANGAFDGDDDVEMDTPSKKPKRADTEAKSEEEIKQEEGFGRRERSATLLDNEADFHAWLNEDSC